jgi:hypothetical protein
MPTLMARMARISPRTSYLLLSKMQTLGEALPVAQAHKENPKPWWVSKTKKFPLTTVAQNGIGRR